MIARIDAFPSPNQPAESAIAFLGFAPCTLLGTQNNRHPIRGAGIVHVIPSADSKYREGTSLTVYSPP